MGFAEDMGAFSAKVEVQNRAVLTRVLELARDSIVEGSAITGAPGQPVDTGELRAGWTFDPATSPTSGTITTNVGHAKAVEDAVGPHGPVVYGAKNGIGGSHSVKLTIAALDRIVDQATREVAGNA